MKQLEFDYFCLTNHQRETLNILKIMNQQSFTLLVKTGLCIHKVKASTKPEVLTLGKVDTDYTYTAELKIFKHYFDGERI